MLYRVKQLCRERGITIAKLERESGLAHGTICHWEKCAPSLDKAIAVANTLGVSLDDLVDGVTFKSSAV